MTPPPRVAKAPESMQPDPEMNWEAMEGTRPTVNWRDDPTVYVYSDDQYSRDRASGEMRYACSHNRVAYRDQDKLVPISKDWQHIWKTWDDENGKDDHVVIYCHEWDKDKKLPICQAIDRDFQIRYQYWMPATLYDPDLEPGKIADRFDATGEFTDATNPNPKRSKTGPCSKKYEGRAPAPTSNLPGSASSSSSGQWDSQWTSGEWQWQSDADKAHWRTYDWKK